MKRIDILNLFNTLLQFKKDDLYSPDFAYVVIRNLQILEPIVKSFKDAIELTGNINLNKLFEFECKKNKIINDCNNRSFENEIDKINFLMAEFKKLENEYKPEDIELFNQYNTKLNDFLNKEEDIKIELYKINRKDMPKVSLEQMNFLITIIDN